MIDRVHDVRGQVRLRSDGLRAATALVGAADAVRNVPGVCSVEGNVRTGTLLVKFDAAQVSGVTLLCLLDAGSRAGTNAMPQRPSHVLAGVDGAMLVEPLPASLPEPCMLAAFPAAA